MDMYYRYLHNNSSSDKQWFVRLDDDTLLCPNRLTKLLSRYNADELYYLGMHSFGGMELTVGLIFRCLFHNCNRETHQ